MIFAAPEEERLPPAELAALQRRKLARLMERTLTANPFYQRKFAGLLFDAQRDPLSALPFTTRAELETDQRDQPPYGTNLGRPLDAYCRLHQTSGSSGGGPLRWLDTPENWEWWKHCWRIIFAGARVTAADRLLFPFSFGPFVGFWSAFDAAVSLGALCLPAGGMTSSARLRFLLDNCATVVCCTPTYALRLVEQAADDGIDLRGSSVRALIVAGEPGGSVPGVRARIEEGWGARVFDHIGMTEIGPWGVEFLEAPGGVHVIETEFIAEVIDPRTGQPLPDGEPGELVLTNLGRLDSPLIRYRTGDRVTLTRREVAGRWFARAEGGVLGRVDDMLIIRGNNVFPAAIEGALREFTEIAEFRLVVRKSATLTELRLELEPTPHAQVETLATRVAEVLRARLHFRPEVLLFASGSLPRFEMKARRVVWEIEPH